MVGHLLGFLGYDNGSGEWVSSDSVIHHGKSMEKFSRNCPSKKIGWAWDGLKFLVVMTLKSFGKNGVQGGSH